MIKRIRLATRHPSSPPDRFAAEWTESARRAARAPGPSRPLRVTVATVLPDLAPGARHDAVAMEWFTDGAHMHRFEAWLAGADGRTVSESLASTVDPVASPVVVAEEVVARGASWLDRRWEEGGPRLKHMALARRAPGLSPADFSSRWRSRAGTVGARDGTVVVIPDEARGLAYVQNHPLPMAPPGPAYDAVNEVWFDDMAGLRRRIDWFARLPAGAAESDLVGESWLLALVEEVVC